MSSGGKRPRMTVKTILRVVRMLQNLGLSFNLHGPRGLQLVNEEDVIPLLRDPVAHTRRRFRWTPEEAATYWEDYEPLDEVDAILDSPQPKASLYVYFILNRGSNCIKVGCSGDPQHRLQQIQTGCHVPLEIVATIPGDLHAEARIHRLLEPYRLNGEWFRDDPMVRRIIAFLVETSR